MALRFYISKRQSIILVGRAYLANQKGWKSNFAPSDRPRLASPMATKIYEPPAAILVGEGFS